MSDDTQTPAAPSLREFQDRHNRNPFGSEQSVAVVGALANVEQHRGVAEVQARMMIARANPRDPQRCMDAILRDCTRPSLAEKALYQYARGGTSISGPSIRLAEAIAQRWGNIASGIKEISRSGGYSECVAYAWDLESGYYDERQYQVRHWRDTKQGGHAITDEREIYEHVANLGARRKRAALLTVIPGDVVEAAVEQCDETMRANLDTSPEALKKMVDAFAAYGVTQAQIEKRCQCRLASIRPAQLVQLSKIFASIQDEMSEPKDWFETNAWTEVAERHADAARQQQAVDQSPTQQNPKTSAKRQRSGDQRTSGTTNTEAPAAAEQGTAAPPSPGGAASPVSPGADGVALNSASHPQSLFEEWLVDENGDPIGDDPFGGDRGAVLLIRALESRWQSSTNREALLANNEDAIAAALAEDSGLQPIVDSMREPVSGTENAAEETAAPAAPVAVPSDRGKPSLGQYLKDFRAAVADVTAETYLDFIAANQDTMMTVPMSTRSLCVKALVEHADRLGIGRPVGLGEALQDKPKPSAAPEAQPPEAPPPATAEAQPEPVDDARYQEDLRETDKQVAAMNSCKTAKDLRSMVASVFFVKFGQRLRTEGKLALRKKLEDAYNANVARLGS